MSRILFGVVAVCFVGSAAFSQDERVFSGPQPGEKMSAFKVLGFSGPLAGKESQLFAEERSGPSVVIFVHEVTRPAFQLIRPLDAYGVKNAGDGLSTHFVWLTADRSRTEDWLRTAQASLNLKSPVSISLDGIEGPGSYGLNRKVALTILVAKDKKVAANFAIVQPNETDAPKIIGEIAKVLGKPAPTADELRNEFGVGRGREMARPATKADARPGDTPRPAAEAAEQTKRLEEQITRVQSLDQEHHARAIARIAELEKLGGDLVDALNDSRAKIAKLEGSPVPTPRDEPRDAPVRKTDAPARKTDAPNRPTDTPRKPGADLPGRTPNDPELIGLMRRMIQPTNDDAKVKELTDEMLKWAGDDKQRKDDLKQFAVRIAHLGYGSEAAKAAIKKLATDLPGRTPMDPELIGLMRSMIQPTNDEARVKELTDEMLKWAGDDKQRKDDLKQFAVRIAHLGYGSEAAKLAIKKLAAQE